MPTEETMKKALATTMLIVLGLTTTVWSQESREKTYGFTFDIGERLFAVMDGLALFALDSTFVTPWNGLGVSAEYILGIDVRTFGTLDHIPSSNDPERFFNTILAGPSYHLFQTLEGPFAKARGGLTISSTDDGSSGSDEEYLFAWDSLIGWNILFGAAGTPFLGTAEVGIANYESGIELAWGLRLGAAF
jgi:hypothetical protein